MYVCMAHTSKTEGALFSSPQRDQVDHAPLYIKDPAWHQAVVYTRLNLLPKVGVAVLYCCLCMYACMHACMYVCMCVFA